jgi:hypothetical protein
MEILRNRTDFHDTVFSQHQDEAVRENTMATEEKPKIPLSLHTAMLRGINGSKTRTAFRTAKGFR